MNGEIISMEDSRELTRLESIVAKGLQSFMAVGDALIEIHDRRLYRIEHETFAEYCRVKWRMSDRRARQLMDASEVAAEIARSGTTVPKTERQARSLTNLESDKAAEAWNEAVKSSPTGNPTAKDVEAVVEKITGRPPEPTKPTKTPLQWLTHYWPLASDEERRLFLNFVHGIGGGR